MSNKKEVLSRKCDVIIPVYNAPQWVQMCVYALFENTDFDTLGKVIIVDDCSNDLTKNLLVNLKNKYAEKIEIVTNKTNKGFVKNCNIAFKKTISPYVLLLNSDCLLSKNTISKLINHIERDSSIGLICPIANNAANLSLEMFPGYSYFEMDKLLETKFLNQNFDACTVVGNCLLITKKCWDMTGVLDEIFGTGYGEETDYQFRAMKKGFSCKVAIDTYVFHKAEASFGTSPEKQAKLNVNRKIFFDRHGEEYYKLLANYEKNDPIQYIRDNIFENDIANKIDSIVYLPTLVQNAGGVHIVVDLVNHLIINGKSINIMCENILQYDEIMLFNPIFRKNHNDYSFKRVISTIHSSTYIAKKISEDRKIPLISFIQGYETYFENGNLYGAVELTYKLADHLLCISKYLQDELKGTFNLNSDIITNGINLQMLKTPKSNDFVKSILIVLRGNQMKGDWLLLDILKKISNENKKLTFNVVYMNEYIEFPNFSKNITLNKVLGPVTRERIASLMKESDIYIDASLNEGFGLTPLEAMAAGCVPIVSNSFGINEYIKNDENGIIIDRVNNSVAYVSAVMKLCNSSEKFIELRKNASKTVESFDYFDRIKQYSSYFESSDKIKNENIKFTAHELEIIKYCQRINDENIVINRRVIFFSKFIPNFLKNKIKKIITKLYWMYRH